MVGPGALDYGNIGLMFVDHLQPSTIVDNGYRSTFSHASEKTEPGYYSVHLDKPGAKKNIYIYECIVYVYEKYRECA